MIRIDINMPIGCIYEGDNGKTEYCPLCNHDDVPFCQYIENEPEIAIGIDERPVYCPLSDAPESCQDTVSRRAAIDALCDNCDNVQAVCAHYPCKQYIAVEKLPSAQPDNDRIWEALSKIYNMDGVPDEAKSIIGDVMLELDGSSAQPEHNANDERKIADLHKMVNYLLLQLEQAIHYKPSAEIVRCKDCVYFPKGTGINHDLEFPEEFKCPCECEDYWYSWKPADDWFCANGKRKGGEADGRI